MLEPCPFCGALPCDWVNNPLTPPASQSDEALVEELARLLSNRHGLIFDEVCGYADDGEECDSSTCMGAMDEDHDVEWNRESYRRDARAILPILTAREAAARAEGRREGIEEAAKVIQKRMDSRFEEHGTREPDTNATYYEGRAGETYEALDEEADDILTILRALAEKQP